MPEITFRVRGQEHKANVPEAFMQLSPEQQKQLLLERLNKQPAQQPQQETTSNPLVGAAGRAASLVGDTVGFFEDGGEWLERQIEGTPLDFLNRQVGFDENGSFTFTDKPNELPSAFKQTEEGLDRFEEGLNYRPGTTWEDVKSSWSPGDLASFAFEQGVVSTPDMVAALTNLPAYVIARAGEIAEERAAADGRETVQGSDLAVALGSAPVLAALERVGAKGIVGGTGKNAFSRVGNAAAGEARTEFAQEMGEDFATTAGTETGADPLRMLDRGAAGAVAGGIYGGGARAAGETVQAGREGVDFVRNAPVRGEVKANPDVAQSDRRVGRMFDEAKAKAQGELGGSQVNDARIYNTLWKTVRGDLSNAADELLRSKQIDKAQHKQLKQALDVAGVHKAELTEEQLDTIRDIGLAPDVEQGFIKALRDLNTLSHDQRIKDGMGPLQEKGRALGTMFGMGTGAGGGAAAAGPAGMAAGYFGGQLGGGIGGRIGKTLDDALGLSVPPSIRRRAKIEKEADRLGLGDPGDSRMFLKSLTDQLRQQEIVLNDEKKAAREAALKRGTELNKRKIEQNHPGVDGWWRTIFDKTGLKPQEAIAGVEMLRERGEVTEKEANAFVEDPRSLMQGNIGNQMLDMLDMLAAEGAIQRSPDPLTGTKADPQNRGPGSPQPTGDNPTIHSPTRYGNAVQAANTAWANARSELAEGERWMADLVANEKSREAKRRRLEELVAEVPARDQERLRNTLSPLTEYGKEGESNASPSAQPAAAAGARPAGQGLNPLRIPGAPPMGGPVMAPEGLGASGPSQKGNDLTPGKGLARDNQKKNLNGFAPHLRVRVKRAKLPEKPKVLSGTNVKNAARQLNGVDDTLMRYPDPAQSQKNWSQMMAFAMKTEEPPVPPYNFIEMMNDPQATGQRIAQLTPGQLKDADHGFENAQRFKDLFTSGKATVETTAKLFLWSFLSRGVSPYVQESLFIDAFKGIKPWVDAALQGNFDPEQKRMIVQPDGSLKEMNYQEWAKAVAPEGSGQPGAGAGHNLNAFGQLFLKKMSEVPEGSNMNNLERVHAMLSDPTMTGQEIRREVLKLNNGIGIDNKVVGFTLLVTGHDDVMVLDRVQMRHLWNDGRFDGVNLYDGKKTTKKVKDPKTGKMKDKKVAVTGTALADLTYGARGLLVYEAIEQSLTQRLPEIYAAAGRPQDASVGRFHWETWVLDSQQEASHGTLDAILHEALGNPDAIAGVTAKEGEYGAYNYGARYGVNESGEKFFLYPDDQGELYAFTVDEFQDLMKTIKEPKTGIVPRGFKVTEESNVPWFQRPEVNRGRLGEEVRRRGEAVNGERG